MAKLSKSRRSAIPPLSSAFSNPRRGHSRPRNRARSDVYEYQPQKVRRADIRISFDKEEATEHNSDDDTTSSMRKPRLIGETVEDEEIPSGDDEELDSDAAFEESDEERFAGFSFPKARQHFYHFIVALNAKVLYDQSRGKTLPKKPSDDDATGRSEVDLAEDESMEDSEGGDDPESYIDVLDVLDGRADSSEEEGPSTGNPPAGIEAAAVTEEEEMMEEGPEEEEEQDSILSADGDVNPNALEGLEKFVSSLETSRKRKGDPTTAFLPRKKRVLEEMTTSGVEGEFATTTYGTSNVICRARCA
jgi:U3 small nucleolar RNA-associated protein 14